MRTLQPTGNFVRFHSFTYSTDIDELFDHALESIPSASDYVNVKNPDYPKFDFVLLYNSEGEIFGKIATYPSNPEKCLTLYNVPQDVQTVFVGG